MLARERGKSTTELVVRELVRFGGDDQESAADALQKVNQLLVGLLRRNVGVNEDQRKRQSFAVFQIGLDEFGPLRGKLARDFGVAVAGKVNEQHFRVRLAGFAVDADEIDGAGASRRGADMGELLSQERVNQA